MPMWPRRHLYPADWPAIARAVKTAAQWRCADCQAVHHPPSGYGLTVHHIDGDPGHNAPENLVALCQRCHLRWHARGLVRQLLFDFALPDWLRARQNDADAPDV